MSTFKKYVLPGIVSLAIIAVLYYVTIPAINIQNVGFWWFCIWCIIIFAVAYAIAQGVEISTEFIEDLRTQGAGEVFKQHREKRKEAKGADGADGTGAKKGKKGKKGKKMRMPNIPGLDAMGLGGMGGMGGGKSEMDMLRQMEQQLRK